MGQSFSLATLSAASAGIQVAELSDLTYENTLGTARFMKCIRARHQHGLVVVKLVIKPFPQLDLGSYVKAIRREREALSDVPNALGYQRILETGTNGFLIRQYMYSSLYDRLSTRPFLEDIERKWLAFQLLSGLRDCHARNVYHGDIKTENILVTSWNWLYITDFSSSYKKTYLPEDNPADFSYYFDTSGRRTCYLAPERFLGAGDKDDGRGITWAMDVFSVGCVIAELFLESPIFSLSQLYKYRKREFDPDLVFLNKIQDKDIRELVSHMIQLEPESRYTAEDYLNFWRRKAFPEYFYSFLHQYMGHITDPSSGRAPVLPETENFGESDERIDRVYYDFDKIAYFLDYEEAQDHSADIDGGSDEMLPVQLDIPNNRHYATTRGRHPVDDGSLIFLTLVVSSVRSTARSTARIRACDLMLAFAERITDEAKLDRVLPYIVAMFNDRADIVKVAALRTMTQLLDLVTVVSPVNAYVFTEYLRPRLQHFVLGPGSKAKPLVRATYGGCLASLAHSSTRILDIVQALRVDGSIPTNDPEAEAGVAPNSAYQALFDVAKQEVSEHFEAHTKALLTDHDASVRRAFLGSVSSLCVFFGSSKASDVVLSHLNTYLNDKGWMLKCAFFHTIVGVATFVGGTSLEEFILPLMIQALTDQEEFVVEKVLSSFASMAELGLFQRSTVWEMVDIVARFLIHPNMWIREATAHFISASTRFLAAADVYCIISPLVQPYLKTPIFAFNETDILDAVKKPLSRLVFDTVLSWAKKGQGGLFWRTVMSQKTFSFGSSEYAVPTISSKDLHPNALGRIAKNEEDEQWLARLRALGMGTEDEFKLLALREYIWRLANSMTKEDATNPTSKLNDILSLKELHVTPQTVFFEKHKKQRSVRRRLSQTGQSPKTNNKRASSLAPVTIADALLDASTTIDGSPISHKDSRSNVAKETLGGSSPSRRQHSSVRRETSNPPSPLSTSPSGRQKDFSALTTSPEFRRPSRLHVPYGDASNHSDGTSTPTDSLRDGVGSDKGYGLKHRSSAMNLLNRRDISKTQAETSTTSTNVFGKVDAPFAQDVTKAQTNSKPDQLGEKSELGSQVRAGHTYDGNDPTVLKLLDKLASENHALERFEFGPLVTPISRRHQLKQPDGQEHKKLWRPEGVLVTTFGEHTGPINRVVASPDHAFFITGSDDGTVKVWDTLRLERNLAHRSRQTHKHPDNARVLCVTFIENTHTFASCATDGSVHVIKVDCVQIGETTKYGKLRQLRQYQLPEGEYAVWVENIKIDGRHVLLLATNTSRVLAVDLRSMTIIYTLENPIHHGTPTCFCVDGKVGWLLLGTSHGILDLWDLRFRLRIKAWGLSGGTPIHRLLIHPFKGRGRWVTVAGGTGQTEITVWEIEKAQCREVLRAGASRASSKENFKAYDAWNVDDEKPEAMLARFATSLDQGGNGSSGTDRGVRALAVGTDGPEEGRDAKYGFYLTGGLDRKLRFWDCTRIEQSMVVSGLEAEENQPKYVATHPTTMLTVYSERGTQGSAGERDPGGKAKEDPKKTKSKAPRSTVISAQQRALLKSHLDEIMDVCILERPVGMTVSVDRKGVIYVFQ